MFKIASKSKTSPGKIFESNFQKSYENLPIYFERLVDSAKWSRDEKSSYTPSNPYDSFHFKSPFIYLLELKSTDGTNVSFYPGTPWEKPKDTKSNVMIKHSQVKALMKRVKKDSVIAGFVINFREKVMKTKTHPEETFFLHILDFVKFAIDSGKSGISREDCRIHGLKIDAHKKQVHYTYDVEKFSLDAARIYLNKGYINKDALIRSRDWINELVIS